MRPARGTRFTGTRGIGFTGPAPGPAAPEAGGPIFERVFCGIDGTAQATEAARQLALLALPQSVLHLVAAVNPGAGAPAGVERTRSLPDLEAEAWDHLRRVAAELPSGARCDQRVVVGLEIESLLGELNRSSATLVGVGSPGHGRLVGAALGDVATAMLHRAPCSVLVARGSADRESFPRTVIVGLDGSPAAARALAAACELRDRLGAEVRAVTALEESGVNLGGARQSAAELHVQLEEISGTAVEALVASSGRLLVVGSRGLRGLRSLGSVSERVAHRSPASVLVVR